LADDTFPARHPMFERLKLLAARLFFRLPSLPDPPADPCVGVREPRKGGPGGRHSAVAVDEPDE
jgi:hypothetical protein